MSVYTIDKCERFVSQRAGCGKAASPDSARGVRPQGVRLLDPICFAKAVTMKLSKKSVNALNGLTSISTNFKDMREAVVTMCQCPQRAYFHFYSENFEVLCKYVGVSMPSTGLLSFLHCYGNQI